MLCSNPEKRILYIEPQDQSPAEHLITVAGVARKRALGDVKVPSVVIVSLSRLELEKVSHCKRGVHVEYRVEKKAPNWDDLGESSDES